MTSNISISQLDGGRGKKKRAPPWHPASILFSQESDQYTKFGFVSFRKPVSVTNKIAGKIQRKLNQFKLIYRDMTALSG
jgi:ribosomal protein L32E